MLSQFSDIADISTSEQGAYLVLRGRWCIGDVDHLEAFAKAVTVESPRIIQIDASRIDALDTAGAFFIDKIHQWLKKLSPDCQVAQLPDQFSSLFSLVERGAEKSAGRASVTKKLAFLPSIGKLGFESLCHMMAYFTFLGELSVHILLGILKPFKVQWRSVINEIDFSGFRAIGIIAVMMFLIGVVLAYQMGVELRVYGANVYVVDVAGIAILREFSPLITSVIIAGRTSTSFAASLGTMKVNEELDALKTMGLSPIDRLVMPKIIGLFISLPLLVVWGDVFGLLGSMVMSKSVLGIGYMVFLQRLKQVVAVKHLYLGLVKTPIFSLIIAGIGCFQGFQAEGSAQSVGERTTKAAVQSIFLIILADALFSVLFNWLDL